MASPALRAESAASPLATGGPLAPARVRIDAVDLLRGLVMVIMMLDHVRDFVHADVTRFDPTDPTRTTPALFLTRWITHYSAPVFVFLAGTGAWLRGARGGTTGELARFLVTRGLWLVVLELTVFRTIIWFNVDPRFVAFLQVIWVIGVSMIVLAALVRLPLRVIGGIGVAMILLHNLLDPIQVPFWAPPMPPAAPRPDAAQALWLMLHQLGFFPVGERGVVLALYPLVPWVGVLLAGYAFGAVYALEVARRRRILLALGVTLTIGFVLLRLSNLYGDPSEWTVQATPLRTAMSFLATTKYPPSLLFLAMTLGPAILALAWFERSERGALGRALVTYGRVPLFFYFLQWIWAHGVAVLLVVLAGQDATSLFAVPWERVVPEGETVGFSLPVVWAVWAAGAVALYPLCRWYAGVKRRRTEWWLSYL